jgi:hypothetical protein
LCVFLLSGAFAGPEHVLTSAAISGPAAIERMSIPKIVARDEFGISCGLERRCVKGRFYRVGDLIS